MIDQSRDASAVSLSESKSSQDSGRPPSAAATLSPRSSLSIISTFYLYSWNLQQYQVFTATSGNFWDDLETYLNLPGTCDPRAPLSVCVCFGRRLFVTVALTSPRKPVRSLKTHHFRRKGSLVEIHADSALVELVYRSDGLWAEVNRGSFGASLDEQQWHL